MQGCELIGKLIEIVLAACQDVGVIDWTPEDGAPESFYAECEIEFNQYIPPWTGGDWFITLLGVFCIIDFEHHLECWHASKIEDDSGLDSFNGGVANPEGTFFL